MSLKVVDGITKRLFTGSELIGKGTLTESGKYVVGATVRIQPIDLNDPKVWQLAASKKGYTTTVARGDISVSEYTTTGKDNKGKQGDMVIPYLSARQMAFKPIDGSETREFLAFSEDNDGQRQYKNIILSDEIHEAIVHEVARASEEANDRVKNGLPQIERSVSNMAVSLIDAATKLGEARRAKLPQVIENKAADGSTENAEGDGESTDLL